MTQQFNNQQQSFGQQGQSGWGSAPPAGQEPQQVFGQGGGFPGVSQQAPQGQWQGQAPAQQGGGFPGAAQPAPQGQWQGQPAQQGGGFPGVSQQAPQGQWQGQPAQQGGGPGYESNDPFDAFGLNPNGEVFETQYPLLTNAQPGTQGRVMLVSSRWSKESKTLIVTWELQACNNPALAVGMKVQSLRKTSGKSVNQEKARQGAFVQLICQLLGRTDIKLINQLPQDVLLALRREPGPFVGAVCDFSIVDSGSTTQKGVPIMHDVFNRIA